MNFASHIRVYWSYGHNEHRVGAVNRTHNLKEYYENIRIGSYVVKYLREAGCDVKVLQNFNLTEKIKKISDDINDNDPCPTTIIIENHLNSFSDPSVNGSETIYHKDDSEASVLSNYIQSAIIKEGDISDRGIKNSDDLGRNIRLSFLDKLHGLAPTVILEPLFISSPIDVAGFLLDDSDDGIKIIARRIYNGIQNYFLKRYGLWMSWANNTIMNLDGLEPILDYNGNNPPHMADYDDYVTFTANEFKTDNFVLPVLAHDIRGRIDFIWSSIDALPRDKSDDFAADVTIKLFEMNNKLSRCRAYLPFWQGLFPKRFLKRWIRKLILSFYQQSEVLNDRY